MHQIIHEHYGKPSAILSRMEAFRPIRPSPDATSSSPDKSSRPY